VLKAIVFDLDDTLYAERDYVLSGFRAVSRWVQSRLGISEHDAFIEFRRSFDAGARSDTFDRWLVGRGFADNGLVAQMVTVYRDHVPEISPTPGTEEILKRLRSQYRLGLLSDGDLSVQRGKLRQLGLSDLFDAVLFTAECGPGDSKPSVRPFEIMLRRLAVPGRDSVYVADNPAKDFLGARRAAMHTIRIRAQNGIYGHLEPAYDDHAADDEIGRVAELEACLATLHDGPAIRATPSKIWMDGITR
jgi:putative hydrolase of the HAD superfamily